jgi:hypothetical protein
VTLDSSGTYGSESPWSGSGGGISSLESKPSYQSSVTLSSSSRTVPDVAYDADPNTGVYVYFQGGWYEFGGTSIGAPQWAGLVAITNQGRASSNVGSLDGRTQTLPAIYNASSSDFHDITSSTRHHGKTVTTDVGYDLVTGRGTPIANLLVAQLVTATATGKVNSVNGGSGGGSAGSHVLPSSPITPIAVANSAALLEAALAASSGSTPTFVQQPAVSSGRVARDSASFDAPGRALNSTLATRITPASSAAAFASGTDGSGMGDTSDDWCSGIGSFDLAPLDGGADSGEGLEEPGSDA